MPYLPDGSFAVAEAWFAKRSKPKTPQDVFWRNYDGFGQRNISFKWPDEKGQSPLHEAAAFGNPTAAQQLLNENPECCEWKTSEGRTAKDVATDGIKWCEQNQRPRSEKTRYMQVAEWCRRAEEGEPVPPPDAENSLPDIGPSTFVDQKVGGNGYVTLY
eukprot:gnl/TRDRNA2_/TRDRNA2_42598_c0_seq1.p1 gnl/TRDRNA2_/TRDRNA2_42598_c0~~gnl/TRDRNA2_/TRDRNA2_42598_c0_seq1.p1  ORF type:complete len:159 (-),score=34.03 gnl/TRDRNA2_/TRDRNA2_42598_c0_seq1:215-691(-)